MQALPGLCVGESHIAPGDLGSPSGGAWHRRCKDLGAKEMLREDKETQEQASDTAKKHQKTHMGTEPPRQTLGTGAT